MAQRYILEQCVIHTKRCARVVYGGTDLCFMSLSIRVLEIIAKNRYLQKSSHALLIRDREILRPLSTSNFLRQTFLYLFLMTKF